MPRGDRTGPWGRGPMTGRGAGYCAGFEGSGFANPVGRDIGSGRGFGRGGGRGWRHMYNATGLPGWARWGHGTPYMPPQVPAYAIPYGGGMTQEQEINSLKQQADYFTKALDDIQKNIQKLESDQEKD